MTATSCALWHKSKIIARDDINFWSHFSEYLRNYKRYRNVTPTKLKILLTAFKWRTLRPCSYHSFEDFPSEMLPWCSAKSQNLFFGRSSIKTIRAAGKISTPFESCKQYLSFGGCNFSVSYLVPEILAQMWRKRQPCFGANRLWLKHFIKPRRISHFCHVWAHISRTR